MDAAPLEPVRWSPRRWLVTITLVFLVQVVLVFVAAERRRPHPVAPQFRTAISLMPEASAEPQTAETAALGDPTLFALPNLHGFSGGAWLTFAPVDYRFNDWSEPPKWLEARVDSLGESFPGFVAANTTPPLLVADQPLPSPPGPGSKLTNAPVAGSSVLRVEGDLAERPLVRAPVLTNWPCADIITNTVVQLFVDRLGDVQPAMLLASSGYSKADQYALQAAASARFQPLRPEESSGPANQLTWGTLVFQWYTVPPPATNAFGARL